MSTQNNLIIVTSSVKLTWSPNLVIGICTLVDMVIVNLTWIDLVSWSTSSHLNRFGFLSYFISHGGCNGESSNKQRILPLCVRFGFLSYFISRGGCNGGSSNKRRILPLCVRFGFLTYFMSRGGCNGESSNKQRILPLCVRFGFLSYFISRGRCNGGSSNKRRILYHYVLDLVSWATSCHVVDTMKGAQTNEEGFYHYVFLPLAIQIFERLHWQVNNFGSLWAFCTFGLDLGLISL